MPPALIVCLALAGYSADPPPSDADRLLAALDRTIVFSDDESGSYEQVSDPSKGPAGIDTLAKVEWRIAGKNILLKFEDPATPAENFDTLDAVNGRYSFRLSRPAGRDKWVDQGFHDYAVHDDKLPEERQALKVFRYALLSAVAFDGVKLADLLRDTDGVTATVRSASASEYVVDGTCRAGAKYLFTRFTAHVVVSPEHGYAYIAKGELFREPSMRNGHAETVIKESANVVRETPARPLMIARVDEVHFFVDGKRTGSSVWHYDFVIRPGAGGDPADAAFTLGGYGFPEPDWDDDHRHQRPLIVPPPDRSGWLWAALYAVGGVALLTFGRWLVWLAKGRSRPAANPPTA